MKNTPPVITIIIVMFGICFSPLTKAVHATEPTLQNTISRQTAVESSQTIPEDRFREIFYEFVCKSLGKDRSDTILSRFKINGNKPVSAGKVDFQVFQKSKGSVRGYVQLIAIVSVNGITKIEVGLSGWVDVFDYVISTTRHMKKGEIITENDIHLVRRNISRLSIRVLTDIAPTVGLMVSHNIKEDTCLMEWMLQKNPLVERGDLITILADTDSVRVAVPGVVMERGFKGDLIKVQNSMSRKAIYARIIDGSTAIVDF